VNGAGSPHLLDALLVLVLITAAVRGGRRGALVGITTLTGLILGLLVGWWVSPALVEALLAEAELRTALVILAVTGAIAVLGHAAGAAVGVRLRRRVDQRGGGAVDRLTGLGVGAGCAMLAIWLFAGPLAQGPVPALAESIRGSVIVHALDAVAPPAPDVVGRVAADLDRHGLSEVFAGPWGGATTVAPVPQVADEAAREAAAVGQASTVLVRGAGCGGRLGSGSGFVVRPGVIVTNAHVVAGFDRLTVRSADGVHAAVAIGVDPALDLAVLAVGDLQAPPLEWADDPVRVGAGGAVLGFPAGRSDMVVAPATVQGRLDAVGRDIYGEGQARRDVLVLAAFVEPGNSGGPFVTADGLVAGVVFAADPDRPGTGYALAADQVRPMADASVARSEESPVGLCRT
jgi:S1-C subfamily serine protease